MQASFVYTTSVIFLSSVFTAVSYNPCCSFPCQHRGVCVTKDDGYTCDCTRTGYHGQYCEQADIATALQQVGQPTLEEGLRRFSEKNWLWDMANHNDDMRRAYMKILIDWPARDADPPMYNSAHHYLTLDSFFNHSYYSRLLPPVPEDCPTPLGVAGKAMLPDPKVVAERLFRRRHFIPDPAGSNMLFSHFAQHFSHTFLKTDFNKGPAFTWGSHHIDASNIYGPDENWRRKLRSFQDGKLKTRVIDGEEWPPSVDEVSVPMRRLKDMRDEDLFALGHEFYTLSPGLILIATMWMREHNRVCDVLKGEHPEWGDEQLYQTARLVVTGEVLKIILEEYIAHVGQYKLNLLLDPTIKFADGVRLYHSLPYEYNLMYHWHSQAPDLYDVGQDKLNSNQFLFNTSVPLKYGVYKMVQSAVQQPAGKIGPYNHGPSTNELVSKTLEQSRQLRTQSLNEYRKYFGFQPYKSFDEFAGGNKLLARDLEELYGDIDALEVFVGLMAEEPRFGIMGNTAFVIAGSTALRGVMGNPILSSHWWRPSTFGGETGFNIVNEATLQKLFCNNMKNCPRISFTVPPSF